MQKSINKTFHCAFSLAFIFLPYFCFPFFVCTPEREKQEKNVYLFLCVWRTLNNGRNTRAASTNILRLTHFFFFPWTITKKFSVCEIFLCECNHLKNLNLLLKNCVVFTWFKLEISDNLFCGRGFVNFLRIL